MSYLVIEEMCNGCGECIDCGACASKCQPEAIIPG